MPEFFGWIRPGHLRNHRRSPWIVHANHDRLPHQPVGSVTTSQGTPVLAHSIVDRWNSDEQAKSRGGGGRAGRIRGGNWQECERTTNNRELTEANTDLFDDFGRQHIGVSAAHSDDVARQFPSHALATAIAQKANNGAFLIAIERFNRLLQPALRGLLLVRRQRVVDARRPIFLLKCSQNDLLVHGWHFELLDENRTHPQFLPISIPFRHQDLGRHAQREPGWLRHSKRTRSTSRKTLPTNFSREVRAAGRQHQAATLREQEARRTPKTANRVPW